MLDFLYKYRKDYRYSQNGEEGIIIECWRRLLRMWRPVSGEVAPVQDNVVAPSTFDAGPLPLWMVPSGVAVEIGGNDGRWCSNTALLAVHNWRTLFVESDYSLYQKCTENWAGYHNVRVQCCYVDGKNINAFVKDDCDLLSLDTDGGDYEIFNGLIARPKIVIMEIDSSIPPNQEGFNSDGGVGYWTGVELGLQKGYLLLCHTGNLVMLRNEYRKLFPEIVGHPLLDYERYFNRAWLKEAA